MKAQALAALSRKQEALEIRTIAAQKLVVPVVPLRESSPKTNNRTLTRITNHYTFTKGRHRGALVHRLTDEIRVARLT